MNTMKRVKLHHLREKIVQDLDVRHIIEYLLTKGAIDDEDSSDILVLKTRTDQTRYLLDLLPRKGFEAFDHFVDSLRDDYDWLYREFTTESDECDAVDEKTFYDAFLLGGVPHPPPYHVVRQKKLSETRKYLRDLRRSDFVVLHGMTGGGKSCLAAAAVDDKNLLMGPFKGSVYWLTLGENDDPEELLSHMIQLLQRLQMSNSHHHNNAPVVDKVLINKERAKDELKRCFLEGILRDGLLILDDVTSDKQIDAFDVGCKILVTTKDLHVLNKVKGRYNVIQVNDGFAENESLALLAQSIDIPVDQLPQQAKVIHSLSQGSPMIIALIAGQLEENKKDTTMSEGRWDYYVKMLSQKSFGRVRRNSFLEQNGLFQTISMSISNLPPEKALYSDFALFMEDVNIKPEVLQTLWSLETKYEAEDIMAFFTKKSLAVCKWSEQFCSSVYGIHDLLLCYLKEQLSCEAKIDLHRKLLSRYNKKCNGEWAKLPNDNYIYSYIGYHMYHAKEYGLFPRIFLDLKFIHSKLKVTGPADVLGDFKKYRKEITCQNNDLIDKLDDFIRFIQVHGLALYKDHTLDIVQCGLLENRNSFVYKEAYNIAKISIHKLYFELSSEQDLISHPLTLPLREEIVSACFTNEINKILVADGSGIIQLWGLDSIRLIKTFRGHHFKVSHLELHPDNERFLSCSEDGTLKLWSLDHCITNERVELNSAGINIRILSPQVLQRDWMSMFLDDSPKDECLKTYEQHKCAVISAKFSHSGKEIVSCSRDCYIVWNTESGEPRFTSEMSGDNLATCCSFSWDDSLLFFGDSNSKINVYSSEATDFVASFSNSRRIIAILCVPYKSNKVVVISSDEIRIWIWEEPEISRPIQNTIVCDKQNYSVATFSMGKISNHSFGKKCNCNYVCAASSNDGSYLVTATSDYVISVWNLRLETLIAEHKNFSGFARCLDTYVEGNTPLLLCGSDDQTVKIWRLDQSSTVSSVTLLPHFDSVWVKNDEWLPIVATPDSKNRVQIVHGNNVLTETPVESSEIIVCAVSYSGWAIFYGCADGQVKMFHITNNTSEVIMKLDKRVIYLQYFQHTDVSLVAAGDVNSLKIWIHDGRVLVCYGQTGPVVQSFLIPTALQLLACNEDGGVKLWDVKSGQLNQVIIGRPTKLHIISADITDKSDILVLADADSTFHVASLGIHADIPHVSVNSLTSRQIKGQSHTSIRCCRISPKGDLLALGLHSGTVLIWNLRTLQQMKELELHNVPVHCLLYVTCNNFNYLPQHSVLLVTVGEKIGWWNVTGLIDKCRSTDTLDINRPKPNNNGTFLLGVAEETQTTLQKRGPVKDCHNKEDDTGKSLLVGCMKLAGSHALKISGSPDSLSFLTIDTSGIIYLLKLLH